MSYDPNSSGNSNECYLPEWASKKITENEKKIRELEKKLSERFEIIERKPDYKAMAEKRQVGIFWDDDTPSKKFYGHLNNYHPPGYSFCMKEALELNNGKNLYQNFTPCAELVELDPITMEPKK